MVARHALKNTLIAAVSITGVRLALLLGGAVGGSGVHPPGSGHLGRAGHPAAQLLQIQANVLFIATLMVAGNLIPTCCTRPSIRAFAMSEPWPQPQP